MKNNLLKRLADKAKNRLLGKSNNSFNEGVCVKVINFEDEDFNLRAKEVFLRSEQDSSYDPIKMLMDENVLIKLDQHGRERYLLETIDKYLKAKNCFERNHKIL